MRKLVFGLVFLMLAALIGGAWFFHFHFKPEMARVAMAAMKPPPAGVAVEAARSEDWAPHVSAIGTFKAVPGIDVASQVAGIVAQITFQNGQDVEQGALLVQLDDSTEQADLNANMALMKNAQSAFDRQQALEARGVSARSNFDLAQAVRDQAAGAEEKHPRPDRAKNPGRAVLRPARHPQDRCRPICRRGRADGVAPAARPDLSRLPGPGADFFKSRPRPAGLRATRCLSPARIFLARSATSTRGSIADTRAILVRAEFANPDKKITAGHVRPCRFRGRQAGGCRRRAAHGGRLIRSMAIPSIVVVPGRPGQRF